MWLGKAGTGALATGSVSVAGVLHIGDGTQATDRGTLSATGNMTVGSGASVVIGNNTLGRGSLHVGGKYTNNGTTVANAIRDDGEFYIGGLTGDGTLTLNNIVDMLIRNAEAETDRYIGTLASAIGTCITKDGLGTQVFAGDAVNHTGRTLIKEGVVILETAFGSGDVVNDTSLIFDNALNTVYNSTFSGGGAVEKRGSATALLTRANNVSGPTTVTEGRLALNDVLGTGTVYVNAETTLELRNVANVTYDNEITLDGVLMKTMTGATSVTNLITHSGGDIDVYDGVLRVLGHSGDADFALNHLSVASDGTYVLLCDQTWNSIDSTGSINASGSKLTIVGTSTPSFISGMLTGIGTLDLLSLQPLTINTLQGSGVYELNINTGTSVWIGKGGSGSLDTNSVNFSGELHIGDGALGTDKGWLYVAEGMEVEHGATLVIGNNALGRGALSVAGKFANNGTSIANAIRDDGEFYVGGLIGDGTLTLNNVADILIHNAENETDTYIGTIVGTGSILKEGPGIQVLRTLNSYTGGTTITHGMLCGEIGFNGNLNIEAEGTYRLTLTPDEAMDDTDSLNKTLTGLLSGYGTLDLAKGFLAIGNATGAPSVMTFNGEIKNTDTDENKNILRINSAQLDAGTHENVNLIGTITYSNVDEWHSIAGNFPYCNLVQDTGQPKTCIDLTPHGSSFKTLRSAGAIYLRGTHALIITKGFEYNDFRSVVLAGNWTEYGTFDGAIVKQGNGRQIIRFSNKPKDAQTHTGQTRVEGGTLSGVLSPNAPLFVAADALYQICCYNGATNVTGITAQTVAGLSGEGIVELGDFANAKDGLLTFAFPAETDAAHSRFAGQIKGKTTLTKTGTGTQIVSAQQDDFHGSINVKEGELHFGGFTSTNGKIVLSGSAIYKMLGHQYITAVSSLSASTIYNLNGKTLTLYGTSSHEYYLGKFTGGGKIFIDSKIPISAHIFNIVEDSSITTLELNAGLVALGFGNDTSAYLNTTNTIVKSGTFYVGYDASGTLTASTTTISGGTVTVGGGAVGSTCSGHGSFTAGKVTMTGGVLNIGTKDREDNTGVVAATSFAQSAGLTITIGAGAGQGAFIVSGVLTCSGTIIANSLSAGEAFYAGSLQGAGTVYLNNASTLVLRGAQWSGSIIDNTKTATVLIRDFGEGKQRFDLKAGSKFGSLQIKGGASVVCGWTGGTCDLQCVDIAVAADGSLVIGDAGTGYIVCDSITSSGAFDIGSNNGTSEVLCNGNINVNGGHFGVGTSFYGGSNDHPGVGKLTCQVLNLNAGILNMASAGYGTSSIVSVSEFNIAVGASAYLGPAERSGVTASLVVANTMTCDGAMEARASKFEIKGLAGAATGAITVHTGSNLTITHGSGCVYHGTILGAGSIIKAGAGSQIFTNPSSYVGGTFINGGMLCGEIGFGGELAIAENTTYRLARNVDGSTDSTDSLHGDTLLGALSGYGTMDLAQGDLALGATSGSSMSMTFNGDIKNTYTQSNVESMILQINNVHFYAGENNHTELIGTIKYGDSSQLKSISGYFPNCHLLSDSPSGYSCINLSDHDSTFAALWGDAVHLKGSNTLTITKGLDYDDFRAMTLSCNWADYGSFTGAIVKQGSGRQIFRQRTAPEWLDHDAPIHTGETRIEGGTLVGVVSPNAPLYVANGTTYQVSCYDGDDNMSQTTAQTAKGLRGSGFVKLADVGRPIDVFTIDVDSGIEEQFSGEVSGNGTLQKIGLGNQVISGALFNPVVEVLEGELTLISIIQGPNTVDIAHNATLRVTGGLRNATVNMEPDASCFEIGTQNVAINLNGGGVVKTITPSRMLCNMQAALGAEIQTNHELRIDGTLRETNVINKTGDDVLVLGEMCARKSSSISVKEGVLCISNKADMGDSTYLDILSPASVDMYSTQTFASLSGDGTIRLHKQNIYTLLDIIYSGHIIGETTSNVIGASGNATFSNEALSEFFGYLEAKDSGNVVIDGVVDPRLKLRILDNSQIKVIGPRTFEGLKGSGLLIGDGNTLTIHSDNRQIFTGDFAATGVELSGDQTFLWGGGIKHHTQGIVLKDKAQLIIDRGVVLHSHERIHLQDETSSVWFESAQTIAGITGNGVLYASNVDMVLYEDVVFAGDIVGDGVITLTASEPVTFTLSGDRKRSFKGTFLTDSNVTLVYNQEIFDPTVIIHGQKQSLTGNRALHNEHLSENLELNGYTVQVTSTEDILNSAWIKGPGTVNIDCAGTFTINRGIQSGSNGVVFNVERGTVIAAAESRLKGATVNLVGSGTTLEIQGDLVADGADVLINADTGILRFTGPEEIDTVADIAMNKPVRIQTMTNVVFSGDITGAADVSKEGPATLTINGTDALAHTWVVKEGRLDGDAFADGSRFELLDGTTLAPSSLLVDAVNSDSATARFITHEGLTLTGQSAYSGIFDNDGGFTLTGELSINGPSRDCGGFVLNEGKLNANTDILCALSGNGYVASDHNITLTGAGNSWTGIWQGRGDIVVNGESQALDGKFRSHTGKYYINTVSNRLGPNAELGDGYIFISSAGELLASCSENINSPVVVNGGAFGAFATMTLGYRIIVNESARIVVQDESVLTLAQRLEGQSIVTKEGLGVLRLLAEYSDPIDLRINSGAVEVHGTLHALTQIDVADTLHIMSPQKIEFLSGGGLVDIQSDLALESSRETVFDGQLTGTGRLVLHDNMQVSLSRSDWNNGFVGQIYTHQGSILHIHGNQTLSQIEGFGTFEFGGADLSVVMNASQTFYGVLENVGAMTFEGAYTFNMRHAIACSSLSVAEGSTFVAEREIEFNELVADGEVEFRQLAQGARISGGGIIRAIEDFILNASEDCVFDGGIIGARNINIDGANVTFNNVELFTGTFNIGSVDITFGENAKLNKNLVLNLSAGATVTLNADETISDIIGHGTVISSASMTLLQLTDCLHKFEGLVACSELIVDSNSPWYWQYSGDPNFEGTLGATAKSHVVLDVGSLAHSTLACDGLLEVMQNDIAVGSLTGSGHFKYLNRCIFEADSDFAGIIEGSGPLEVRSGCFTWSGPSKSPTGLVIVSTFEANACLDQNEHIVFNAGSVLLLGVDHVFSSLEGSDGIIDARQNGVAINGSMAFLGTVQNAGYLNMRGEIYVQALEGCGNINIENDSEWQFYVDTSIFGITLEYPSSILVYYTYAVLTLQHIAGSGRVQLNDIGTVHITGNQTSAFDGDFASGKLHMYEQSRLVWGGRGIKSLVGEIVLHEQSILEVTDTAALNEFEQIYIEPDASLKLHGWQKARPINGSGHLEFDKLTINLDGDFTLDANIISSGSLTFMSSEPREVHIGSSNPYFTGSIYNMGQFLELDGTCYLNNTSLVLQDEATLILHSDATLNANSALVSAGARNELVLMGTNMSLPQVIFVANDSELIINVDHSDVTITGDIQGTSIITKNGAKTLRIASDNNFGGVYNVQYGCIEFDQLIVASLTSLKLAEDTSAFANNDLVLHDMSGLGSLLLSDHVTASLYLSADFSTNTAIRGGCFEVLSELGQEHNVTLLSDVVSPETLTIGQNIVCSAPNLENDVIVNIAGYLFLEEERTFASMNVTGFALVPTITIRNTSQMSTFSSGVIQADVLDYDCSNALFNLVGDAKMRLHEFNIHAGKVCASLGTLIDTDVVRLGSDCTLQAVGDINYFETSGCIIPERSNVEPGELPYGVLRVKELHAQVGAVALMRLSCLMDNALNGVIHITESAEGLGNLSIVLESDDPLSLRNNVFPLMSFPAGYAGDELPEIAMDRGICPLIEAPSSAFQLDVLLDSLVLITKDFQLK
ncbi:MAG: autotransporter-associated beta strand repeat-containing protein [Holosporales bacterium]|nr:autotransporter-associated beta strand repeat-containing protein [Holosporales bacterium]